MKKIGLYFIVMALIMVGVIACSKEENSGTSQKKTEKQVSETTTASVEETDNLSSEMTGDIYYYYEELEDGTLSVYGYDAEVVPEVFYIPSEINGKTVSQLEKTFSEESNIKKVIIPETVTVIADDTFAFATSIEEIEIKGEIEIIGDYAIYKCEKLETLSFRDGLKKIGHFGISKCPSLKEVHLPGSVEEITGGTSFIQCASNITIYAPSGSLIEEYVQNNPDLIFQAE